MIHSFAVRCGSYNLGFSGNTDPEPGRCRRTDGKKWRCSKDAVGDQKYCERHLNRGRHRSRKHVEGHNGHAEKTAMSIPSQTASAVSDGSSSNLSIAQQLQSKCLQSSSMKSTSTQFDRILTNKRDVGEVAQDSECALFSKFKQQNSFEAIPAGNSNSQNQITISMPTPEINAQQSITHPLLHFIDDWPQKDKVIADRTQLSISIPNDSSDYSLSPIRLVHEFNRLEDSKKHSSWIPISWDDPMMGGGPLGEVLTKKKEDR
ncbi:Growth-regulating factor 6 [Platanthera zijinensis]|uniref:Growth-regulating factor n=1 Tax=Platanthera zijinensis TaxID=2320716 RepID=A0AAP0BT39_9ASPA